MDQKTTRIFVVMTLVIMALLAIIIFRKPDTITIDNGHEKVLQDSLILMKNQVDSSHVRQTRIQNSYDSLLTIDPQVQYRTHEKIKIIYSTATPNQLDSIIRANWKTELRHN
jgi:Cdc6-like AAA superfamily ATPase